MTVSTLTTTSRRTIVHVLNGLAFGGTENFCLQLLCHAPSNVQNVLLNLNPDCSDMLPLFSKVPNLVILEQPYHRNSRLKFIWKLSRLLKQLQPDAILIGPFGVHIFVALAARLVGIPYIAVHAGNPMPHETTNQRKWKILVILSTLLRVPICSCSQAVHQSFQQIVKLPEGSFPIFNGCDVQAIATRSHTSRKQHHSIEAIIIGMVARLNPIKDQETLIKAFAIVHSKFSDTQLWLIGDGEERRRLQALTNELELHQAVRFWGNRADVPELLGQMDIYAFSTTSNEGFGIALVEAMAASLPVVASDVAACREVLGAGKAGFLFPQGDVYSLAHILDNLLTHPHKRVLWGQRAYEWVTNHYSIQHCAEIWYQLLLQPGGSGSWGWQKES